MVRSGRITEVNINVLGKYQRGNHEYFQQQDAFSVNNARNHHRYQFGDHYHDDRWFHTEYADGNHEFPWWKYLGTAGYDRQRLCHTGYDRWID